MRTAVKSTTTLLLVVAGVAMAATAVTAKGTDLRSQRAQDLKSLVLARARDAAATERSLSNLRAEVNDLAVQYTSPELRKVRGKIAALRPVVANTAVTGSGLVVTLDDAPHQAGLDSADFDPNWLLVHQQDIEAVVNALWSGGARAVSVMGERITSNTAVRCVGSTVLVNGKVFSPPFVIRAIGNEERLSSSLEHDANVKFFRNLAGTFGMTYDVQHVPQLFIAPFDGGYSTHFARPLN